MKALMVLVAMGALALEQGSLRVKTDVSAVSVYVDGSLRGSTPAIVRELDNGPHQVRLTKEGYTDEIREVTVPAGGSMSIFVVMRSAKPALPQPASPIAAIHKHVVGICRGVLSFEADRFRYDAGSGAHRFDVPYAGIKNISLSAGPVVGATPVYPNVPANLLPIRIETRSGAYSFWIADGETPDPDRQKSVFDFLYHAWQAAVRR